MSKPLQIQREKIFCLSLEMLRIMSIIMLKDYA